jgi:hypothetical protein
MLSQPDSLLLEMFDAIQKELSHALEACARLPETIAAHEEEIGRTTLLRKISKLRIILAELEVALERRPSKLVH